MATLTFADLVQKASDNTYGTLAGVYSPTLVEGKSWEWPVHIDPGEDNTLDLIGVAISGAVLSDIDGSTVATLTATALEETATGWNQFTLVAEPAETDATAGTGKLKRALPWYCTLELDGRSVDVWSVQESRLIISQGV